MANIGNWCNLKYFALRLLKVVQLVDQCMQNHIFPVTVVPIYILTYQFNSILQRATRNKRVKVIRFVNGDKMHEYLGTDLVNY